MNKVSPYKKAMYLIILLLSTFVILTGCNSLKCKIDDIIDAICLSVTANLAAQVDFEAIPENPMMDDNGLFMQMIIPKL